MVVRTSGIALLIATSLLAAGCGGSDSDETQVAATPEETDPPPPPPVIGEAEAEAETMDSAVPPVVSGGFVIADDTEEAGQEDIPAPEPDLDTDPGTNELPDTGGSVDREPERNPQTDESSDLGESIEVDNPASTDSPMEATDEQEQEPEPESEPESEPEPEPESVAYIDTFDPTGWEVFEPVVDDTTLEALIQANQALAFKLYKTNDNSAYNTVVAPYQTARALAQLVVGTGGSTRQALLEQLALDITDPAIVSAAFNALQRNLEQQLTHVELTTASALWGQIHYKFSPDYLANLAQHYSPDMFGHDFVYEAGSFDPLVDQWVAEHLGEDFYLWASVDFRTRQVSTDVFGLTASLPLDPAATFEGRFALLNGNQRQVPLMTVAGPYPYAQGEGWQAVEVPVGDGDLGLLLIMPDEERFEDFQAEFNSEILSDIDAALTPQEVTLFLPRFDLWEQPFLPGPWGEAFEEFGADFSAVNNRGYLYLARLKIQAVLNLSEQQILAKTTTTVVYHATRDEPDDLFYPLHHGSAGWLASFTPGFTLPWQHPCLLPAQSRPFLFLIRDQSSGLVLFMGHLTDPNPDGEEMKADWWLPDRVECGEAPPADGGAPSPQEQPSPPPGYVTEGWIGQYAPDLEDDSTP